MKILNGIFDIPEYEYHTSDDYYGYINAYAIPELIRSPFHYLEYLEQSKQEPRNLAIIKKEFKDALRFGSACHKIILEDGKDILIQPKKDKAYLIKWQEENFKSVAVTQDEFDTIQQMKAKLFDTDKAYKLLFPINGENEKSIFCESQYSGIYLKGRPDVINREQKYIIDYKTCLNAFKDKFIYDIFYYDYDIQAAFYPMILKQILNEDYKFFFVAQEKTKPFEINIFNMSSEMFAVINPMTNELIPKVQLNARRKINYALKKLWYYQNMKTNGGYSRNIINVDVKPWQEFNADDEEIKE